MKPSYPQLQSMLSRVLAALETPQDLSKEERQHLIDDAGAMLAELEAAEPAPLSPDDPPLFRDVVRCFVVQPVDFGNGLASSCSQASPDAGIEIRWHDDDGSAYKAHIAADERITPEGDYFWVNDSKGESIRMMAFRPIHLAGLPPPQGADAAPTPVLWHVDQGLISMLDQSLFLAEPGCNWCAIATGEHTNDAEQVVALAHPENARRITACVNAAAGIPIQELEAGVLRRARDFVGQLARMTTDEEMDGEMCSDDAVESLNIAIRQARKLNAAFAD